MSTSQYQTSRTFLKEITQSDKQNIFRGLSDPQVVQYYGVSFFSLEATQEQMDWYEELATTGTGIWWGVYLKETGEFCGAGGFNGLDKYHRKAEIGFWLLPEYWGKSILKEVMPLLFSIGFNDLKLNRIEGFVQSDNEKCKRALEKVNFRHEGTMRACEIKDGKLLDVDIYAALNPSLSTMPL